MTGIRSPLEGIGLVMSGREAEAATVRARSVAPAALVLRFSSSRREIRGFTSIFTLDFAANNDLSGVYLRRGTAATAAELLLVRLAPQ